MAVMKTARWWPWDLPSGGHQEVGWVGDWRGDADAFRFQPPPVEPCMRFSRTRLTAALHRRCSTGARQARLGLGAAMIPLRETRTPDMVS